MYSQQGQRQGRHSGRGPKGYQRSDDRIREDVCERLTFHPDIDAVEIEVTVRDGEVTLTGAVDDRLAKRMAEDVAENVSGVKDVKNQVQIRQQHQLTGAHQGQSGTERGSEKTATSSSSQKR
jgi:osmotically-inducible protein OsmY